MSIGKSKGSHRSHWFSVDICIESDSNAQALDQLLRLLKTPSVTDYRIQKGIELEKTVEAALQQQKAKKDAGKKTPDAQPPAASAGKAPDSKPEGKQESAAGKAYAPSSFANEIERYMSNNTLVRMTVVKGKGVKLSIPCRILNYDAASENVSIYHVDEKKVYLFRLNEIDDLQAG